MNPGFPCLFLLGATVLTGQTLSSSLSPLVVNSPRIANQAPVATFAMPVSALRFEPLVDVQGRNMAEGQADVTVRGGTFENSGFRIGAVTLLDPQTGHYFAEIPVPPSMLGAPVIQTGISNALGSTNVTVGSIAYGWQPVNTMGRMALGVGQHGLNRQELAQGVARPLSDGLILGAQVDFARSASDGSIAYGDHRFQRVGGRIQLRSDRAQTDLFAGYQAKFFGWPNLYTPYGVNESENLQTVLLALNHRLSRPAGGYLEAGIYHRRNKDDYEYNRLIPGQYNPYQHTTWMTGVALEGREVMEDWAMRYRAEFAGDKIASTSLTSGRYQTRQISKLSLAGEHSWKSSDAGQWKSLAGLTWDKTNRDGGALSPLVELARHFAPDRDLQSITLGYAATTQVPSYTALNSAPASGLFRGNANLGRESSRNLDLSAEGVVGAWELRGSLFHRWDNDLVDWTYKTGVTARSANAVDVVTTGLEFVGRRDFDWGNLTLGYTCLTKDADYGSAAVDASFYALNYARHRLTAALTVQLSPEWELRMDNEARVQEANPLRTMGGHDALLSALTLAWRPRDWRGVEFAAEVDNLWNSDYQDVPAVPAARRQVALSVAYGW
ncbi:MAG: TonB-dependent receptor [Cephaloticoccus sp.]|nr:TonB-dependent receptor [Cephaloticoccus sp.]